jgi:hypothetical protein
MPTYDYFPFDSGLGANSMESRWRTMFQKFKTDGIMVTGTSMDISANNCAVSAGSGMTVTIVSGIAFIKGHIFSHTGTDATLAIGSNTSGSTRTDLVVLRCDFVNNTMGYLVLQGTITPVQNANQWDIPLCNIAVPNNASSASSFTFTDRRKFAIGGSGLVPTIRRSGASFTLAHNASVYTAVNLSSSVDWVTDYRMYPGTDNTKIYITQDGFYELYSTATFGGVTGTIVGNPRRIMRARINGAINSAIQQIYAPNTGVAMSGSSVERLLEGDYIQLEVLQDCGSGTTLTVSNAQLSLHYLNPLTG